MSEAFSTKVGPLVEQIRPILAGKPPPLQSAVLADLTAMWLAGFFIPGEPAVTAKIRELLLGMHIDLVRQLVEPNAKMLGTASGGNPK